MENLIKVTLSSKKVVMLREPKIKHQELAVKAVGNRAGDNKWLFSQMVQKELLKIMVYSIDNKVTTGAQIEDLDSLFSLTDYSQLLQVIAKVSGGEDSLGEPQLEFSVSSS